MTLYVAYGWTVDRDDDKFVKLMEDTVNLSRDIFVPGGWLVDVFPLRKLIPTYNQVDIYRSHIAELLAPITGVAAQQIYPALQWTQILEYGDLMLPVPALRIKGKKPDQLAVEIKEQCARSDISST